MKISELLTAFQQFAETQESRGGTAVGERQPRQNRPVGDGETAPEDDGDRIVLSAEAVFRFAASQYDPRHLRQADVHGLADILHDGGAIDSRDHALLTAPPPREPGGTRPDRDLIQEFQGRLSRGIAAGDIAAVEKSTRALSLLGRLASIRSELQDGDG